MSGTLLVLLVLVTRYVFEFIIYIFVFFQLKKASKKTKDKDAAGLMDIDDEERDQMEALAKKFEEKYVSS
jgi:hypothetical protein